MPLLPHDVVSHIVFEYLNYKYVTIRAKDKTIFANYIYKDDLIKYSKIVDATKSCFMITAEEQINLEVGIEINMDNLVSEEYVDNYSKNNCKVLKLDEPIGNLINLKEVRDRLKTVVLNHRNFLG